MRDWFSETRIKRGAGSQWGGEKKSREKQSLFGDMGEDKKGTTVGRWYQSKGGYTRGLEGETRMKNGEYKDNGDNHRVIAVYCRHPVGGGTCWVGQGSYI